MVAMRSARICSVRATAPEPPGIETLERPLRRELLPEHTRYVDSGCSVHPSCLTCPLVRCRYEEPGGVRRIYSRDRDLSLLEVKGAEKLTVEAVARRFGVSRRTVFRIMARAREEGERPW